ncbi:OLC1v1003466C1 [Oldenlandia corymbosa var. corymbosa]|uniref:OLC1v1003466C1 n=1 Tax=Oldenlandia corymbosa var. corymbosa TaxID=529605 RepID=A0AAV1DCH1_OLDCO|nr:OLC1v1003466C1 [Oldenlandia corymbosa var. corymbosa]
MYPIKIPKKKKKEGKKKSMGSEAWLTSPTGKWLGFVTAIWVQSISGNNYTFSNYSDALKSIMKLTQLQLNQLSVVKDVGKAFGLLAGFASDKLPLQLILLIGAIEGFIGYGAQWLVVSQTINPLPYWAMCIFMCLGGNSTTWMNTAILVTCIRNFKKNRGPVSGILKGYVGLSTAIFTDSCAALFANSPSPFLVMLAVVPLAVCFAATIFLREVASIKTEEAEEDNQEGKYLGIINILSVIVAVYLLIYDVIGSGHGHTYNIAFVTILLILLALPLYIPLNLALKTMISSTRASAQFPNVEAERSYISTSLLESENSGDLDEVEKNTQRLKGDREEGEKSRRRPAIGDDHTILEAFGSVDFWILFVSFLFGVGTGMTVMNNMGQMGAALGYQNVAIFVSLLSIAGFFGRIISGSASEYFIKYAFVIIIIYSEII